MTHRLAALLLVSSLAGCACASSSAGAQGGEVDCGSLPAARPPDVSLSVTRTVIPRGQPPQRSRAELVTDLAHCTGPRELCRVVAPATLDRVYALTRALAGATSTPVHRSPHYGSRFVHVRFSEGRCSVGESSSLALDARGSAALSEAFDAIVAAFGGAAAP